MFCTDKEMFTKEKSFNDNMEKDVYRDTLEKKIIELEKKNKENFELFLRAKADAENAQKRADTHLVKVKKEANDSFLFSLFNLADSIEFGLGVCKGHIVKDKENSSVYVGLRLIYEMLLVLLNSFDVKQVNSLGAKFNPHEHEAILLQECVSKNTGIIVEVVQKGYIRFGRVLRHSKVVVTK